MEEFGYKSELKNSTTPANRSQSQPNDFEFEESAFIDGVLTLFQQESNLALINKGISELNQITFLSKESISFRSFFIDSDIIKYLFDFIQSNTIQYSTKIEIINIFNNVIDWYDDERAVEISELNIIDTIYNLMQLYFPESDQEKETINCLQTILIFLTKLASRDIDSRDSILLKYPSSNGNMLAPFEQLFEMIKALSEIESLQTSYIYFFSSLCYYKLDFEMIKIIYNEYVITMFDKSIVKNYDSWDSILPIIRYFIFNGYGQIVGERDITYQILIEAIVNGNSKAANTALKIMDMLVDLKFDVFSRLDFPYLCENITNKDPKISIGIMNLIEVLIKPATIYFENESQNAKEDQNGNDGFTISPSHFNDPLIFLFNNKLLSQLQKVLIDGSCKQKISSLNVIMSIFERKQTTYSPQEISNKIIKENIIKSITEILEIDEINISKIVCDILTIIFNFCVNDNQKIASVMLQIGEYGENLLIDLMKKIKTDENDDFQGKLQFILSKIDEYKNKEEIISLIFAQNENDDHINLQNGNDENENEQVPFNQGSRKRSEFNPAFPSIL